MHFRYEQFLTANLHDLGLDLVYVWRIDVCDEGDLEDGLGSATGEEEFDLDECSGDLEPSFSAFILYQVSPKALAKWSSTDPV